MKLFQLLSFKAEKELAARLALHVEKNLPPKLMNDKRHILSANKITRILEQAFEQALDHKEKFHPGVLKRAVLVNNVKWELRNKGFPNDFIDVMAESLIVALSRRRSAE
jgi:hypothetical protein